MAPGKTYQYYAEALFSNGYKLGETKTFKTLDLKHRIELVDIGPTSLAVQGEYDHNDADIEKIIFLNNIETENGVFVGLKPQTEYSIIMKMYVKNVEIPYEASSTIKTTALELETLQPESVSASKTIVSAKTNISEKEISIGFQWKKYDAPSTLKPSEGYGVIYDGKLEGILRNLQPQYYNVRAFYRSADDTYYYSDWITFDPSDFSYFEPIVHTYPTANVSCNSAYVQGYVLEGSDEIESQGIQFWTSGESSIASRSSEAINVEAEGTDRQIFTVMLTNLLPDTEYTYRAFVLTKNGYAYGEEFAFQTSKSDVGSLNQGNVFTEFEELTIIAYYDMMGKPVSIPTKGHIYIVIYSNGSARKIRF